MLASASSTGYTVVWDLRGRREVIALAYGGGNIGGSGGLGGARGVGIGGGRGVSDVAWHPDNVSICLPYSISTSLIKSLKYPGYSLSHFFRR